MFLGLFFAHALAADVMTTVEPSVILALIQEEYELATLERDDVGDPVILTEEAPLQVRFYECEEDRCGAFQVRRWWPRSETRVTLEQVNAYNARMREGKAYLDADGDLTVDLHVRVRDGVTMALIKTQYVRFLRLIASFPPPEVRGEP